MNAHNPFDAKQDWANPYCQNSSNDPMVDALLGNAYHVVRTVYCNLGNLKLLYDFLNQYGMVLGVQSEAELKALTADAKYARIYGFSRTGDRQVTDYLYVEGDRTGILPNDAAATGSWITVATSGSSGGDTSSGGGAYIPWVYSNGSATGGETTINVPDGTVGVPFIIVNGDMQYVGRGFEFNIDSLSVTLAQPLEEGDEVVFLLTGVPAVPDNPNVNDWVQINWLYNNGAAVGGEQVIAIPYTFQSVPAVYKNGLRLYKGLTTESYTADPDNQRILLTEPLTTNDRLIVQIGGEAQVLEASDHTLQEVARAANVKDSEVILSTDTTQVLNGKKIIYSVSEQKAYGLPSLPSNIYISAVSNGQLTYNPGNITVTLLPTHQETNTRELWRRLLAEAGLSLVAGSFEEGATVNSETDAVWHIATGQCYTWAGTFPKTISENSTPDSTGGVSSNAWIKYSDFSTNVSSGFYGGSCFPTENNRSLSVGDVIPSGVMFIRVNGKLMMLGSALTSSVTVTSFDQTVINDTYELFPASFFNEVVTGWKIAQNDAQLTRLLPKAGNIYIGYSPVKVEGIFTIQGDIQLKPLLPKVTVDSRQFWLRSPRTWNDTNQEYDYTAYDIRIVGNFLFDFYRQDASFDPGVGLAMQSAGTLELSGCELQGAWNNNVTMDYGRWALADNLYSHDCGRGKIQQPDGSNRQGMAIIVGNATEAHIHHIRTRTTWASSVFIDAARPGRTLNVMIHDVSINGSGGNGLRLQSDDLVTGVGGGNGTAITRVNISNVTIKNCDSHGLRANFTNGSVTGVYIEACNAGIAIEGSSDVTYDNIVIKNCSQPILCRYYPVICTRLRFSNILISGHTDWAVFFLRKDGSSHTVNLGDIEFDGLTIHCTQPGSKAVMINCGANSTATSDITMKNVRIVGAFPDTDGTAICQIHNARHIEVDNWNIRGINGKPSSYLYAQAAQSLNINRLVGVQPFGTVERPIECVGVAGHVNIVNCSVPVTTKGILYTTVPAYRYEKGNQFYNSNQPQQFPFTNAGQLRGGDVNTLTTTQLANIVATLINDISLGKFVVR